MDLSRAREDRINKKFTDVKLKLLDEEQIIELDCHKLVLISLSAVFLKMFSFGDSLKSYDMVVPNAIIVKYIIDMYYDLPVVDVEPKWLYELEMIRCQDFLCINKYTDNLDTVLIPTEGIELLFEISDIILAKHGATYLKQLVRKNLPVDYPISQHQNYCHLLPIIFDQLNEFFASIDHSGMVNVFNITSQQVIRTIQIDNFVCVRTKQIEFSPSNKQLIIIANPSSLLIYDIETGELISSIVTFTNITNFASDKSGKLLFFAENDRLQQLNLSSKEINLLYQNNKKILNFIVLSRDIITINDESHSKKIKFNFDAKKTEYNFCKVIMNGKTNLGKIIYQKKLCQNGSCTIVWFNPNRIDKHLLYIKKNKVDPKLKKQLPNQITCIDVSPTKNAVIVSNNDGFALQECSPTDKNDDLVANNFVTLKSENNYAVYSTSGDIIIAGHEKQIFLIDPISLRIFRQHNIHDEPIHQITRSNST